MQPAAPTKQNISPLGHGKSKMMGCSNYTNHQDTKESNAYRLANNAAFKHPFQQLDIEGYVPIL